MTNYSPYGSAPATQGDRYNNSALVGFILSLGGLIFGFLVLGIPGLILGRRAQREIAVGGERGEGLAKAAVILGWIDIALIALALVAFILLFALAGTLGAVSGAGGAGYTR